MRNAAATLAAVTTLTAAPAAHAGWEPARVSSHELRPLAAAAPGTVFSIWGAGDQTRRLTFQPPRSAPLPFPSNILSGPWLANRRGDVLMVDRVGRDGALLVEAGGARVRMSMELPRGVYPFQVARALAEDGSAVVAWTATRAEAPQTTVWVKVRPPGGRFGPRIALRNAGFVSDVDADIEPGGRAEVVRAFALDELRYSVVHAIVGPDGVLGSPTTLATEPGSLGVDVVGGRVISGIGAEMTARTQGAEQALGRADLAATHRLADGGVVLASVVGHELRVRRAAAGAPFGPPQRVARIPRGAIGDTPLVTSSTAGALLIAWRESINGCVRDWCFDRVLAAAAEPGQPFGAPQLVSPLGTRTDRIVAALADDGRRMIAWRGNAADASAPKRLAVAFGDTTPEVPVSADRRPPRVRLLSSRERGGKLRLRLRSDEPVAVRTFVGETARGQAVVVPANRATTVVWSLTRYQRGKPPVIVAADAAGNVRTLRP